MSSRPELLIEVYVDPQCPWCRIGELRLIETLNSSDFAEQVGKFMSPQVKLLPYILDPRLPASSFDPPEDVYESLSNTNWTAGQPPSKKTYYDQKFVGTGVDAFENKINAAAQPLGIASFDFRSETGKVGATWYCHRLIAYAEKSQPCTYSVEEGFKPSTQIEVAEKLYDVFLIESRDISDRSYLSELASELGLFGSQEEALKWLESDEMEYEVKQALQVAKMNGIESIPFLIVSDGADHLSGSGSHDELMRMFNMAAAGQGLK